MEGLDNYNVLELAEQGIFMCPTNKVLENAAVQEQDVRDFMINDFEDKILLERNKQKPDEKYIQKLKFGLILLRDLEIGLDIFYSVKEKEIPITVNGKKYVLNYGRSSWGLDIWLSKYENEESCLFSYDTDKNDIRDVKSVVNYLMLEFDKYFNKKKFSDRYVL
jgi:hypothetical protein